CRLHPAAAPSDCSTLSLHDALPILHRLAALEMAAAQDAGLLELRQHAVHRGQADVGTFLQQHAEHVFRRHVALAALLEHVEDLQDRKSTRLNSSHVKISYAVFCLKK